MAGTSFSPLTLSPLVTQRQTPVVPDVFTDRARTEPEASVRRGGRCASKVMPKPYFPSFLCLSPVSTACFLREITALLHPLQSTKHFCPRCTPVHCEHRTRGLKTKKACTTWLTLSLHMPKQAQGVMSSLPTCGRYSHLNTS